MDYLFGSVKLMLFAYLLLAIIAFGVAFIIKGIFAGIKLQRARELKRVAKLSESSIKQGRVSQESRA